VGNQPQITDYLTWTAPGANASYGDVPDGQPIYRFTLYEPSPGNTNSVLPFSISINEWMARNSASLRDPADFAFDDWFELYNAGSQTVDLGGYYLTDDPANLTKFPIPNNGQYRIAPRGFLLVWADDTPDQNAANRADLHVNFKLGGSSGTIGLFAPDGLTPVSYLTYGEQTNDISQGRYTDGASSTYYMTKPTPKGRNAIPGVNTPPLFPPLDRQYLAAGERVTVNVRPSDPDYPEQLLTFAFEPARAGAAMNASGLFRWIVPTNQPPGDYTFILHATDNGVPPRSATALLDFTITGADSGPVNGTLPPVIQAFFDTAGQVTLTFGTLPGRTYRVLYADDLGALSWIQLDRDFVAANPTASLTDTISTPRRFYRVLQVN
jgi:hypothetical protein